MFAVILFNSYNYLFFINNSIFKQWIIHEQISRWTIPFENLVALAFFKRYLGSQFFFFNWNFNLPQYYQASSVPRKKASSWQWFTVNQVGEFLANIYLFKINNRNTWKRWEMRSKLTIKTPERRRWRRSCTFTVNFEHNTTFFRYFYCWLWTNKCLLDKCLQNLEKY